MTEMGSIAELRLGLTKAAGMGGLAQATHALDATYTFLLRTGLNYAELRPIFNLLAALSDHERGKPHPMLAVVKRRGNRSFVADDQFRAVAAAAMTMLTKAGVTKPVAAQMISARLKDEGIDISSKKIDTWHREISSERHADDSVIGTYKLLVGKCGTDPAISAEAALRTLPTLARTKL